MPQEKKYDITPLSDCLQTLLGPGGCPWDREQTHQSIRQNFLEEAHEVVETIDQNDLPHMQEELGDMLLQVLFHSMFGEEKAKNADEVLSNWEAIKLKEHKDDAEQSIMTKLPPTMPALMRAEKVQEKARRVGFDWENADGAWQKVYEELDELKEAVGHEDNIQEELGDVLFSVVNVARFAKVDAETALKGTTDKFISRFKYLEKKAREENRQLSDYSLARMDKWWDEAKNLERK